MEWMEYVVESYPDIAEMFSIGKTYGGLDMYVLKVGNGSMSLALSISFLFAARVSAPQQMGRVRRCRDSRQGVDCPHDCHIHGK
jgi:hypothetical protein